MNGNVYHLFQERFPADRSRPFIEMADGRIYGYGDLEATTGRFARLLLDLGVERGDRVAGQVEKSAEAIFLYLACLRIGAVYMPLSSAYREAEVGYFLSDAGPRVVVGRPEAEDMIRRAARQAGVAEVLFLDQTGGGSLVERSRGLDADAPVVRLNAEDLAAIVYTSGTTGRAKGAMLPHGLVAWNAATLRRLWGWRPDDVLLHVIPIAYGLFGSTNLVLMNGTGMIVLPRFDVAQVVGLLPRATVFIGVPTHYTRLLADPRFTAEACQGMRLFVSGSAPLAAATFDAFEARTGHRLLDRYGMTETLLFTSNPLDGERLPDTSGPPLPGVEVRVTGDDGAPLPAGEVGMIEMRGPAMFKGYWGMPEKTAEAFRDDGFFVTGDMGHVHPNGYVSVVGRGSDLIISGGLNVQPKEVETAIEAMEGVAEAAVVGVPHADLGEAVIAVVARQPGWSDPTEEAVIRHLKDGLAGFKVPKRIVFVDALPRNALGKVTKAVLREHHKDAVAGETPPARPQQT